MKKYIPLIIATSLLFASCRKEADHIPYVGENSKLAYNTYAEQFKYLWKCLSTGYVFWDIDTVDWDAAYTRYLPRFEALDAKFNDSGYVRTAELEELYKGLTGKMRDHHMAFFVNNLHPMPGEAYSYVIVQPGLLEVQSRDYFIERRSVAQAGMKTFLANLYGQYTILEQDSAAAVIPELSNITVFYHYCLFSLPDGRKVPYLWTTNAAITPVMRDMVGSPAQTILDR